MSAVFDETEEWKKYSVFFKPEPGDFTTFYAVIAVCTVFAVFLIVLNVGFCCSRYRDYWCDSNTGNRWILPIWTKTPDKQPPLDLTELSEEYIPVQQPYFEYPEDFSEVIHTHSSQEEFLELHHHHQKRESDL